MGTVEGDASGWGLARKRSQESPKVCALADYLQRSGQSTGREEDSTVPKGALGTPGPPKQDSRWLPEPREGTVYHLAEPS